jgi:hypothetical protein
MRPAVVHVRSNAGACVWRWGLQFARVFCVLANPSQQASAVCRPRGVATEGLFGGVIVLLFCCSGFDQSSALGRCASAP